MSTSSDSRSFVIRGHSFDLTDDHLVYDRDYEMYVGSIYLAENGTSFGWKWRDGTDMPHVRYSKKIYDLPEEAAHALAKTSLKRGRTFSLPKGVTLQNEDDDYADVLLNLDEDDRCDEEGYVVIRSDTVMSVNVADDVVTEQPRWFAYDGQDPISDSIPVGRSNTGYPDRSSAILSLYRYWGQNV